MKTDKVFAALLAVLTLAACSKNTTSDKVATAGKTFTVGTESFSTGTRTSMNSNREVLWSNGDLLSVWAGTDEQTEYKLSGGAGTTSGSITAVGEAATGETELSANVAVYPYIPAEREDGGTNLVTISEEDGTFTIEGMTLSQHQQYAAGSFANGSYPMVAVTSGTDDETFAFKNLMGVVKLTLTGNATIKRIQFVSNDEYESVAGYVTITASNGSDPVLSFEEDGETSVTLDCGDGVALTSEGTSFYIALPPTTFTSGFSFVVTDSEGKVQTISSSKSQEIKRNTILNMPAVAYEGTEPHYMTFVSQGSSTLGMSVTKTQEVTRSLQYSYDTVNWSDWTLSGTSYESLSFSSGKPLYLRGSNPNGLSGLNASGEQSIGDYVTFTMSGSNVECEGDVMTLLNYEDVPTEIPNTYCFTNLFAYHCQNLVKAPKLGATTLKSACYNAMFAQCVALTEAPELPATELAESCYGYMFAYCSSMEKAPELPATTLVKGCYNYMFMYCTSLNYLKTAFTSAPADEYTTGWLASVASKGTFVNPNASSWSITRGVSTVPADWTIASE